MRRAHQALEERFSIRHGRIEGDAALAGGVRPPVETAFGIGIVAVERPEAARGIARRRLDLQHVRAQVGQDAPAQKPALVGEIEHAVWTQH